MSQLGYRFAFGLWTIQRGADPFGPPVRPAVPFDTLLETFRDLGADAVQFHDDEAVPDVETASPAQIRQTARATRQKLEDYGLKADLIGSRVWEAALGADGAFTANDPKARQWAMDRAKKAIDIIFEMGGDLFVIWYARDGTYMRESKDAVRATHLMLEGLNELLAYHPQVRVAIEPKPNEPMDQSYCPTIGHALALAEQTAAPERVGCLVESAHAILAGLDPADEMAFALAFGKLWNVHLNDQNGPKFDEDRAFGTVNLRRAFDQVLILDDNRYYATNATVCFDVKALRTQPVEVATKHLRNSVRVFLRLVELARSLDRGQLEALRAARDYEELDWLIVSHLTNTL